MVSVTCTSLVYHSSSQDSNHGRSQHKGQRLRRERHVGGGQEGSEYDGGKHSEGKCQRAGHAHNRQAPGQRQGTLCMPSPPGEMKEASIPACL